MKKKCSFCKLLLCLFLCFWERLGGALWVTWQAGVPCCPKGLRLPEERAVPVGLGALGHLLTTVPLLVLQLPR